jgi:hypothetical protein
LDFFLKNKRGSGNGGQAEQQKALAERTNTICLNSFDYGMNIGASKKGIFANCSG